MASESKSYPYTTHVMSLEDRIAHARARVRSLIEEIEEIAKSRRLTSEKYKTIQKNFEFLETRVGEEVLEALGEKLATLVLDFEKEIVVNFIKSRMHLTLEELCNEDLVILHVLCQKETQ